jgi:hypothetical protein
LKVIQNYTFHLHFSEFHMKVDNASREDE